MDNIVFEKVWQEEKLIELKISAKSEFVTVYQYCYIQAEALHEISMKICRYINNDKEPCYLEFGKKEGNFTPAFSMCILPVNVFGHVKLEVDFEIADNERRLHRCCFYLKSELGLIEQLAMNLKSLVLDEVGAEVSLV